MRAVTFQFDRAHLIPGWYSRTSSKFILALEDAVVLSAQRFADETVGPNLICRIFFSICEESFHHYGTGKFIKDLLNDDLARFVLRFGSYVIATR